MAKFAVSQNKQLTLVFEDKHDLKETTMSICNSLLHLCGKYEDDPRAGAILAVLNILVLPQASTTTGAI